VARDAGDGSGDGVTDHRVAGTAALTIGDQRGTVAGETGAVRVDADLSPDPPAVPRLGINRRIADRDSCIEQYPVPVYVPMTAIWDSFVRNASRQHRGQDFRPIPRFW